MQVAPNKKIKLTGTAISEFEFSVLRKTPFKIPKYSAPYVPAAYFHVMLHKICILLNC